MVFLMEERISESGVIEDRDLAEYYNLMAKRYMRIPCQRVLKRVVAQGIRSGTILDVGTGPGIFPIFLSKSLPQVRLKGLDLSPVMVEIARRNAMEEGLEGRVEFMVGSAYRLPCEDRSIDLVLCINTLHHLNQPVRFFDEVSRVLKEDGGFVIVDFHRDTPFYLVGFFNLLWRLFFRGHPKAKDGFMESVQSSYTIEECMDFLKKSNLKGWKLTTRTIEVWIESTKKL